MIQATRLLVSSQAVQLIQGEAMPLVVLVARGNCGRLVISNPEFGKNLDKIW